jgi:hypothetical protein
MASKFSGPVQALVSKFDEDPSGWYRARLEPESNPFRPVGDNRYAEEFFSRASSSRVELYQSKDESVDVDDLNGIELPTRTNTSNWTHEFTEQPSVITRTGDNTELVLRRLHMFSRNEVIEAFVNSPRQLNIHGEGSSFTEDEVNRISKYLGIDPSLHTEDKHNRLIQLTGKKYLYPKTPEEFISFGRPYTELPADVIDTIASQVGVVQSQPDTLIEMMKVLNVIPRHLEELNVYMLYVNRFTPEELKKTLYRFAPYMSTRDLNRIDYLEALTKVTITSLTDEYIDKLAAVENPVRQLIFRRFNPRGSDTASKLASLRQMISHTSKATSTTFEPPESEIDDVLAQVFTPLIYEISETENYELKNMLKLGTPHYHNIRKDFDWTSVLRFKSLKMIQCMNDHDLFKTWRNALTATDYFNIARVAYISLEQRIDIGISLKMANNFICEYLQDIKTSLNNPYWNLMSQLEIMTETEINDMLESYFQKDYLLNSAQIAKVRIITVWARMRGIKITAQSGQYIRVFHGTLDPNIFTYNTFNNVGFSQYMWRDWDTLENAWWYYSDMVGDPELCLAYLNGSSDVEPAGLMHHFLTLIRDNKVYKYAHYINVGKKEAYYTGPIIRKAYQEIISVGLIRDIGMIYYDYIDLAKGIGLTPYGDKDKLQAKIDMELYFGKQQFEHDPEAERYLNDLEMKVGSRIQKVDMCLRQYFRYQTNRFTNDDINIDTIKVIVLKNLHYYGFNEHFRRMQTCDDIDLLLQTCRTLRNYVPHLIYMSVFQPKYSRYITWYCQTLQESIEKQDLDHLGVNQVKDFIHTQIQSLNTMTHLDFKKTMYAIVWLQRQNIQIQPGDIKGTGASTPPNYFANVIMDSISVRGSDPLYKNDKMLTSFRKYLDNKKITDKDYNLTVDYLKGKTDVKPKHMKYILAHMFYQQYDDLQIHIPSLISIFNTSDSRLCSKLIGQLVGFGFNIDQLVKRDIKVITENDIREFSKSFWLPNGVYSNTIANPTTENIAKLVKILKPYRKLYTLKSFDLWTFEYEHSDPVFAPLIKRFKKMLLVKAGTPQAKM